MEANKILDSWSRLSFQVKYNCEQEIRQRKTPFKNGAVVNLQGLQFFEVGSPKTAVPWQIYLALTSTDGSNHCAAAFFIVPKIGKKNYPCLYILLFTNLMHAMKDKLYGTVSNCCESSIFRISSTNISRVQNFPKSTMHFVSLSRSKMS